MKTYAIILACLLVACCPKKAVTNTESTTRDSISVRVETQEITKGFTENVFIPVPQFITGSANCDSLCNEAVKRQMQAASVSKTSGKSAFEFQYKPQLQGFELQLKTADNVNNNFSSNTNVKKTDSKVETITVEVIPRWVWWVLVWGVLNLLFWVWRIGRIFM